MTLPDCMLPDGADPCRAYLELKEKSKKAYETGFADGHKCCASEIEQLKAKLKVAVGTIVEIHRQALIGKIHGTMDASAIAFDCERACFQISESKENSK